MISRFSSFRRCGTRLGALSSLRGIPVIASDAGAIPESMLGLPYIVPIKPLTGARDEDVGAAHDGQARV